MPQDGTTMAPTVWLKRPDGGGRCMRRRDSITGLSLSPRASTTAAAVFAATSAALAICSVRRREQWRPRPVKAEAVRRGSGNYWCSMCDLLAAVPTTLRLLLRHPRNRLEAHLVGPPREFSWLGLTSRGAGPAGGSDAGCWRRRRREVAAPDHATPVALGWRLRIDAVTHLRGRGAVQRLEQPDFRHW